MMPRCRVQQSQFLMVFLGTKLADQNAELQARVRQVPTEDREPAVSPPPSMVGRGLRRVTSSPAPAESTNISQLRRDLSKAQHERHDLYTRLESAMRELDNLKSKARVDSKRINQLDATTSQLNVRLRDREEELRGKAKLVENVQDENVTLNLQLNMAEEQSQRLRKENKELVDRWMARIGKEADRMNDEHKFG